MNNPQQYRPWALVTGASDGIGKVVAETIASGGLNVVLVARREDRLRALDSQLRAEPGVDTVVIAADLAEPAAIDRVEDLTRQLDIGLVVLAAGFGTTRTVLEPRWPTNWPWSRSTSPR
jgi:short-subunit dehydrogenase